MFRIACRAVSRRVAFHSPTVRLHGLHGYHRRFSLISIHSSFPASLLRLQRQPESTLLDHNKTREDTNSDDRVLVSDDGLVYPQLSMKLPFSNGATFMPNTFTMQEFVRISLDEHLENIKDGKSITEPVIYSVKKGTPIPSALTLLRMSVSQFSLQPSSPVSLKALNSLLDDFYSSHAEVDTVGRWLESHAFEEAFADHAEADWMNI
ncbi:hypothetical protein ABVK25_007867 [Lepraria finkii]|uniref:Tse2 ADP-ribosyltransferase toxin domain-containing protein n=1 Tax=Lepraria finkii TaxID=1340010 RepID=A0ABR4B222_9LECA